MAVTSNPKEVNISLKPRPVRGKVCRMALGEPSGGEIREASAILILNVKNQAGTIQFGTDKPCWGRVHRFWSEVLLADHLGGARERMHLTKWKEDHGFY